MPLRPRLCVAAHASPPPDPAHYFFKSQFTAEMFFYNVSSALKDRGVFYGIVPEAKAILALMGDQVGVLASAPL